MFFEVYGQANRFTGQPMTRQTVFDLASLTKPLATTLAVACLVDRGRIDLDQPVTTWLPVLAGSDKAAITPRQLLGHQSGLPAHRLFLTLDPQGAAAAFTQGVSIGSFNKGANGLSDRTGDPLQ